MAKSNPTDMLFRQLAESLSFLARELCASREQRTIELEWFKSHFSLATKQDLKEMEKHIMSVISDWNSKVSPKLDLIQTGLDALQALVEQLQNSPGAITPEDQALLDQIDAKVDAIAGDADTLPKPPVS